MLQKIEGKRLRSKIPWKHARDRISAKFFKAVQKQSMATAITNFKNEARETV